MDARKALAAWRPSGWTLKRRLAILLAALAVVAIAVGWFTRDAIAAHDAAEQRAEVRLVPAAAAADELLNSLVDQETGLRGFSLTGDGRFLEPYEAGRARQAAAVARLEELTAGDATLAASLQAAVARIEAWRQLAAGPEVRARREAGGTDAAAALEAKERFDEVRTALGWVRAAIGERLDEARAEAQAAEERQWSTLVVFVAVMAASVGLLAVALFRFVSRPIDVLRSDVRRAAEDLSHPVAATGPCELVELATDVEALRVRLRDSITKATAMLAAMGDAYTFSTGQHLIEVNDRMCELSGYRREELVGMPLPMPFWGPESMSMTELAERVGRGEATDVETSILTRAGERVPVSVTVRPAMTDDGLLGWITTMRDLSEFKRREHDLRDIASRDALTGLYNRRAIEVRLDELRDGDALVAVDLDHFKRVNDSLGHAGGDQVLRDLCGLLEHDLRDNDWAGRLGGEEFILVLGDAPDDAVRVTERLRTRWLATNPVTTFSAGVAVHDGRDEPRQTLARADEALYAAKRAGRDRVVGWISSGRDGESSPAG